VIRSRILVLAAALLPATAAADGLYLKLQAEKTRVPAAEGVKVKLTAVSVRYFSLPASPAFLIDDGKGSRPCPETECRVVERAPAFVTPDAPTVGAYEVILPAPGRYKIRAQYKLKDRVIQSNAVKVEVIPAADQATMTTR